MSGTTNTSRYRPRWRPWCKCRSGEEQDRGDVIATPRCKKARPLVRRTIAAATVAPSHSTIAVSEPGVCGLAAAQRDGQQRESDDGQSGASGLAPGKAAVRKPGRHYGKDADPPAATLCTSASGPSARATTYSATRRSHREPEQPGTAETAATWPIGGAVAATVPADPPPHRAREGRKS